MNKVFGYTRVSTAKQGTGVSLQEQKEAIVRFAEKNSLTIVEWFEELETAAKQGRPKFNKMISLIRKNKADGAIIHKIDRSARNLKDWALLGDLIDEGYKIYFAHESLNLNERGGRLAADIQAVIASDYIRNLREETIKGLYGRVKQGIYPLNAPTGYLDMGGGIPKAIDPVKGPLIKLAFELYASGRYSLNTLCIEMYNRGLRNARNQKMNPNILSRILNNPFYSGVMKIKGVVYPALHEPIISGTTFKVVQNILTGKTNAKPIRHEFLFSKIIKCKFCGYSMIAERQKGNVYYRCHTKNCFTKSFREDQVERLLIHRLNYLSLSELESETIKQMFLELESNQLIDRNELIKTYKLKENNIKARLNKLTDLYLDGLIDKLNFDLKRNSILIDLRDSEEQFKKLDTNSDKIFIQVNIFLELLSSFKNSYIIGNIEEKRRIIKIITSNFEVEGKKLIITMQNPFQDMFESKGVPECALDRDMHLIPRVKIAKIANKKEIRESMQELLNKLIEFFKQNPEMEITNLNEIQSHAGIQTNNNSTE